MAFPVSCFILLLSASRYCDEKRPLPHCPGASLSLSSPLFFKYLLSSYKKTWKAITSPFSRVVFSVLESPCNAAAKQDHKDRAANVFFSPAAFRRKGTETSCVPRLFVLAAENSNKPLNPQTAAVILSFPQETKAWYSSSLFLGQEPRPRKVKVGVLGLNLLPYFAINQNHTFLRKKACILWLKTK